jgi:U6 snRNA-associated Sm-like protein LSm1
VERIYLSNKRFAENYVGVLLIRGENVLLLGDIDIDKEEEPISKLQQISFKEAKFEEKKERELLAKQNKAKSQKLHKAGLVAENFS